MAIEQNKTTLKGCLGPVLETKMPCLSERFLARKWLERARGLCVVKSWRQGGRAAGPRAALCRAASLFVKVMNGEGGSPSRWEAAVRTTRLLPAGVSVPRAGKGWC